jgi:outer membrane lipoprotein-sorting protein
LEKNRANNKTFCVTSRPTGASAPGYHKDFSISEYSLKLIRRWLTETRALILATGLIIVGISPTTIANPPATQPADPPIASHELLEGVQKKLLTVTSIQADFTQQKRLTVMKHTLNIRGTFAMQKPDKFVWSVQEPVRYAIRVEGDEIRQWDEDTNKVQVIHAGGDPTFKAITDQIQSWFLGDYKSLEQSYDVFQLGEKPLSLRFAPRGESMVSKLIKNIEVTFDEKGLQIDKMVIHETSGDLTTINYSNVHLNEPINADTWEIPPK